MALTILPLPQVIVVFHGDNFVNIRLVRQQEVGTDPKIHHKIMREMALAQNPQESKSLGHEEAGLPPTDVLKLAQVGTSWKFAFPLVVVEHARTREFRPEYRPHGTFQ